MQKVSVVIVNWNTGRLLARCLATLCAVPDTTCVAKVVVVDNASTDHSLAVARERLERLHCTVPVTFLRQKTNTGFARATNIGIASAERNTHVLLLNPDTEVLPGALEALVAAAERDAHVAIVGPKLLNADHTVQPSVRSFPSLAALAWLFLKLHCPLPTAPWWRRYIRPDFNYEQERVVDQVMGAAFLVHHQALRALGTFDVRFWLWFEEVDYCKRAHDAGWKVLYTPAAQIVHHGAASFNQLVGFKRTVPFLTSALYYARKHLGHLRSVLLLLLFPLAVLLSIPSLVAHVSWRQKNKTRL